MHCFVSISVDKFYVVNNNTDASKKNIEEDILKILDIIYMQLNALLHKTDFT